MVDRDFDVARILGPDIERLLPGGGNHNDAVQIILAAGCVPVETGAGGDRPLVSGEGALVFPVTINALWPRQIFADDAQASRPFRQDIVLELDLALDIEIEGAAELWLARTEGTTTWYWLRWPKEAEPYGERFADPQPGGDDAMDSGRYGHEPLAWFPARIFLLLLSNRCFMDER